MKIKRKVVLKRLSASDLTLFENHYRSSSGAKQKAFNLDVSIFVDELYPGLPDRMDVARSRIPVDLSIFGPGRKGLHNLQRKILKQEKNWRLDGELIYNPPEDEDRYNVLQKGDYVIIEFDGELEPNAAKMYLVASSLKDDEAIFNALESRYSTAFSQRKGMEVIDPEELAEIVGSLNLKEGHPVLDFEDFDALEDAVLGGAEGLKKIMRRRKARGIGKGEFEKARRNAENTGMLGEELLNSWLSASVEKGTFFKFNWDSFENAVSPYDFSLFEKDGSITCRIDAKSTSGGFSNPIHASFAELFEMANGDARYDIYRIYSITEKSAKLRIAENVRGFAKSILDSLENIPNGVRVDGVSIDPNQLAFGDEIEIIQNSFENNGLAPLDTDE